jgi:hypothetical protein
MEAKNGDRADESGRNLGVGGRRNVIGLAGRAELGWKKRLGGGALAPLANRHMG